MVGPLFLVVGVVALATAWLAARGRLPRNRLIGLRTSSTLSSDAAWCAGHKAAAWSLVVLGCVMLLAGAVLVVVDPSSRARQVIEGGTVAVVLPIVLAGGVQADRVAKRVDG